MMEKECIYYCGSSCGICRSLVVLEYRKFLPMYNLFSNMTVHILVTRCEALSKSRDNAFVRALKLGMSKALPGHRSAVTPVFSRSVSSVLFFDCWQFLIMCS